MNGVTKMARSAALLGFAFLVCTGAHAQQGARFGLGRAVSTARVSVPVSQPPILFRSYPVYYGANSYRTNYVPRTSAPASGPYMIGPGQWVPSGTAASEIAMEWQPGDSRATPAAASGHWDWKRTSLAELVELSRRNKSSRGND